MGPLSDAVLMQASKIKMSCAFQLADLVGCEVVKILEMSHCTLFLPSSVIPWVSHCPELVTCQPGNNK